MRDGKNENDIFLDCVPLEMVELILLLEVSSETALGKVEGEREI